MDAFQIFEGEGKYFLPRLSMYFDDIIGSDHSDFTGERLAMADFNSRAQNAKISPDYGSRIEHIAQTWKNQVFIYHNFTHPDYCRFVGPQNQQNPLRRR
jgi:hypothetical protein